MYYMGLDIETDDPLLKDRGKRKAQGPSWIFGEGRVICTGLYNGRETKAFEGNGGEFVKKLLLRDDVTIVGANIQYDIGWLLSSFGMSSYDLKCSFIDVSIVESLIDEYQEFSLDALAVKYLKEHKQKSVLEGIAESLGLKGDFREHLGKLWDEGYSREIMDYVKSDADQPLRIWNLQKEIVERDNLWEGLEMNMSMIPVVVSMQQKGVRIDVEKWKENCDKAREAYERLKGEFEAKYGNVNINSPKQLAELLDKFNVPYKMRITVKGFQPDDRKFTSDDRFQGDELTEQKKRLKEVYSGMTIEKGKLVLYLPKIYAQRACTELLDKGYCAICNPVVGKPMFTEFAATYPIVNDLVQYKQVKNIVDKFLGPVFGRFIAPDGRLHGNFNIVGARHTGRLSCLAKGTKVLTTEGEVPIEDIKPGMKVITHTGAVAEVKALLYQGKKPCIKLTTNKFHDIICTKDHKFWTGKDWVPAEKLKGGVCVNFKELLKGCRNLQKDCKSVCIRGKAYDERISCNVQNNRTQHTGCNQGGSYKRAENSRKGFEIVKNQDWSEKSYVWEKSGETPELERGLFRQEGTLYYKNRRRKSVCAQKGFCRCFRNKSFGTATVFSCAPHRRKSCEQCFRQFGTCNCTRSQHLALTVSGEIRYTFVGELPTFDIALSHPDHSFIANGWLVHNCKMPNLQQIPSKTKLFEKTDHEVDLAHMCREVFTPEPGEAFVKLDYSGQENRVVAHFAMGKNGDFVQGEYAKNPYFDEHDYVAKVSGLEEAHGKKVGRKFAKNLRFGVSYGMQKPTMMKNFGWTKEFCDDLYEKVAGAAPWLFEVMDTVQQVVLHRRYIKTLAGRHIHLRKGRDKDAYKYMNYLIQGSASDMTKKATVVINKSRKGETMLLTVHDEDGFSVPMTEEGVDRIVELQYCMEHSSDLRVPAVCNPEIGPNWADGIEWSPEYGDVREFIREVFRALKNGTFYKLKEKLGSYNGEESFSEFCESLEEDEDDEETV